MTDLDLRPQFPEGYHPRQDGGRLIVNFALREMAWDDYAGYLQTNHWRDVRAMAYRVYGARCTLGVNCSGQMDVHHRTYDHLGDESSDDVEILCRKHHFAKHDAETAFMRDHARRQFTPDPDDE